VVGEVALAVVAREDTREDILRVEGPNVEAAAAETQIEYLTDEVVKAETQLECLMEGLVAAETQHEVLMVRVLVVGTQLVGAILGEAELLYRHTTFMQMLDRQIRRHLRPLAIDLRS
jgi:hypothetical protein